MSAHTPGPWVLGNENNDCCDVDTGKTTISLDRLEPRSCVTIIDRDEMLANARLVAAAPDLLAALQTMVSVVGAQDASGPDDGSLVALAMAHDAITKAVKP